MPRGGGRRSAPAPAKHAPVPRRNVPAPVPQVPQQQASRGPGLFGQMAATAGGVAIGSAAGHMIGNAMSGGRGEEAPAPEQQQQQQYDQSGQQRQLCDFELKQFLDCAQRFDLSSCENLNQILKECRTRYGV